MIALTAGDEARALRLRRRELEKVLPAQLKRGFHGLGSWGAAQ